MNINVYQFILNEPFTDNNYPSLNHLVPLKYYNFDFQFFYLGETLKPLLKRESISRPVRGKENRSELNKLRLRLMLMAFDRLRSCLQWHIIKA